MEDKLELAIQQYDIKVGKRYRLRGGWLLETGDGPYLLREYEVLRGHFDVENRMKEHLRQQGFFRTDRVVPNREADVSTQLETGEKYVLYQWFSGNECDLKNDKCLRLAGKNLAQLHQALVGFAPEETGQQEVDLYAQYERHNRELKRIHSYMKTKKKKNEFEVCAIRGFQGYYEKAWEAAKRLGTNAYYQEICDLGKQFWCHGDYNYHNLIFQGEQVATIGFEKAALGIPLLDLTYFMRKTLEKNEWRRESGNAVLQGYESVEKLLPEQQEFIGILLMYPEKYWKLMNQYYNKKKSWLSAKSLEKLRRVGEQEQKREAFVRQCFKW